MSTSAAVTCSSGIRYDVNELIYCNLQLTMSFEYFIAYFNGTKLFQPSLSYLTIQTSFKNYTSFFGGLLLADPSTVLINTSPINMYLLTSSEFKYNTKIKGFYIVALNSGTIKIEVY